MKRKIFIFIIIGILLIPFIAKAGSKTIIGNEYETKNFIETLEDEELEKQFTNYQESDDKITIYLFRGKGCSYCRAYLNFMDSITEEYGKYFNMVSFEVWNNENNWNLMQRISYYLQKEVAGGVPYIIIGNKVFPGFASSYEEGIKKAIVELYNTNKDERYDVFKEAEKDGLISIEELKKLYENKNNTENENINDVENTNQYSDTSAVEKANDNSKKSDKNIILWNLLFVGISTIILLVFNNYKFNELKKELNNIDKTEKKKKKV